MEAINIALIVSGIILGIYLYLKKVSLTFWKRKGVPYIEPEFFYGNIKNVIKAQESFGDAFLTIYREFKSRGVRHGGMYFFFSPAYVPIDPEIVKNILQRDFNHFVNHGVHFDEEADPLSGHLFSLEDAKWKNLRAKLTPTFTSGKMKMMFQTLVECSNGLESVLGNHAKIQDPANIKEIVGCFSTDVIGSCAFGLDCNSLKDPNSEFRKYGKLIFEPTLIDRARLLITILLPRYVLRKIGFRQIRRDVENFFMTVVKDIVTYREKNNVFRKDFMHLLLQLKNRGKVSDDENIVGTGGKKESELFLTMNELAAQCFVFFLAGFETSSTTMTYALYELSVNPKIQDKVREEIQEVLKRHDNKITYDAIMEMTYLDKVVNGKYGEHITLKYKSTY